MTAPAPSPQEQAVIDRFGIFDEERIVEEVARAICAAERHEWEHVSGGLAAYFRRVAVAAITAYRATQDGAVEAAFAELEQHRSDLLDDTHELSRGRALGVGEAIDVLRAVLAAVDPS